MAAPDYGLRQREALGRLAAAGAMGPGEGPTSMGEVAREGREAYDEWLAGCEPEPGTLVSPSCSICGEAVRSGEAAEMYDPENPDEQAEYVHAECGVAAGLEVA